jgi:hypothetical protein
MNNIKSIYGDYQYGNEILFLPNDFNGINLSQRVKVNLYDFDLD